MHTDFAPLIHLDWKAPGSDLLALLQHHYPHIDLFGAPSYDALLDQLSNEMAEVCFEVLAPLLAARNLDLWNLDAGADDYHPVIVPSEQRHAFAEYWQRHLPEPLYTATRIEPPARPPKAKKSTGRRPKLTWLQDVHEYPGPTYVSAYNYSNGWAAITEQDEDQWLCFLLDYHPWPPTEQDMLEQRSDGADGSELQLVDATAERTLWKRLVQRGAYGRDDRYVYESRRGDVIQPFGPADMQWPEFAAPALVLDEVLYERQEIWEPEHQTLVWRISAHTSEVIFQQPGALTLLAMDGGRLLAMHDHDSTCWLYTPQAPQPWAPAQPLPVSGERLRGASAYLGGDEILLFSDCERANAEDAIYPETVLLAWRFNVQTGAASRALLDGFGSELRQQTSLLAGQPKRTITLRTFIGQLHTARGHGDWWLWTYSSNTFGTHTLAWWWNAQSNQVLKLTSKDIARVQPFISYVPEQDRYLLLETDFVARLPPFAQMLEAKGSAFLTFE
ncbi:MAG: hypothetical protein AAGC84_15920 [Pseudomonas sp.]